MEAGYQKDQGMVRGGTFYVYLQPWIEERELKFDFTTNGQRRNQLHPANEASTKLLNDRV